MPATFWIDTNRRRLWNEEGEIALAPKPLSVLCALVERPGEILTRRDLEAKIWSDVRVTDGVLRYSIRQVRQALGDDAATPGFIATVPRRGWQLIARVKSTETQGTKHLEPSGRPHPEATHLTLGLITGRDDEMARLGATLERARNGEPKLVFLTGEAGIGKTTVLNEFLRRSALLPDLTVATGECIQHYGSEEPYAPAIEALERLVPVLGDEVAIDILRRHAPAWLAQLPGLTGPEEHARLAPSAIGTTAMRMLRQFAHLAEAIAKDRTLVLAFDDVHWSDTASLELLDFLVRRPRPLRLLVLATLRPAEVASRPGPLAAIKRDLEIHGLSEEILLDGISSTAVDEYLAKRLGSGTPAIGADRAGAFVHRWTEGNPLFMVSIVDQLIARGALRKGPRGWILEKQPLALEAPTTVRRLIEEELDRVNADHRDILEAASVAGMEFSAASVAAATSASTETVEAYCEQLCRSGRFLRSAGEEMWPDGTIASRYRFGHALYREILSEGLPAARRARMHRAIGLRRERACADQPASIAGELAHHFDHGGDTERALRYFALAGDGAARRYANREAVHYLRRAIRLLAEQTASQERDATELVLRLAASAPLAATQGYASPDLAENLARVQELTDVTQTSEGFLPVLLAVWSLHIVRADLPAAHKLGDRLLEIANEAALPVSHLQAHRVVGHTHFYSGDLARARVHLDAALDGYDVAAHAPLDYSFGDDPVVLALSYSAWLLWFQGQSDAAVHCAERAMQKGRELQHPPSHAFALSYTAVLHQLRGDPKAAIATTDELLALAEEEALPLWLSLGRIVRGWAWGAEGKGEDGVAELRAGLDGWEATGSDLGRPHFLGLLAEALGRVGGLDEGLELLETAGQVIHRTGQHVFEPERLRLEGELLAAAGRDGADERYQRAIEIAVRQGAHGVERRASASLSRLHEGNGLSRLVPSR